MICAFGKASDNLEEKIEETDQWLILKKGIKFYLSCPLNALSSLNHSIFYPRVEKD